MGDPFLPAARLHAGRAGGSGAPAQILLDDPGQPGRNLGGAGRNNPDVTHRYCAGVSGPSQGKAFERMAIVARLPSSFRPLSGIASSPLTSASLTSPSEAPSVRQKPRRLR